MHTSHRRPPVRHFWRSSCLLLCGVGLLLQVPGAAASSTPDPLDGRCNARNVAGTYGFVGSGAILPGTVGLPPGLFATVGLLTFDGQGCWATAAQSLTINGTVTSPAPSMAGAYTVQPNCTFTLTPGPGSGAADVVDAGVFVQHRQEGFFMATVEGVVVTFTMKRIDKQDE